MSPWGVVAAVLAALAPNLWSAPAAEFKVTDYGAKPDGRSLSTPAIQKAIDAAAEQGGVVTFAPGTYVSGALFLKSGIEFRLDDGVVLQAVQDDSQYPLKPTRVAGIEMVWPSALVNVYQQHDVKITGKGVIDGNGEYWWHKFWGADGKGGMLKDYRERGLRWAVDYDCQRVRALAVFDARDIEIRDVTIKRSGFWSLTLTYSERVTVSGVTIRANIGGYGPSSDGVDIDSCRDILVEHCDIDCNDDNICLKAGRDADGLRVNRPTENVTIRHCVTRSGHGMLTLGSETSGGIRNVHVHDLQALGTANGIRIKSARVRGGVIENVRIHDITMEAVDNPLHFELNWYPSYSYPSLPADMAREDIPAHWAVLTTQVEPPERGIPEVRNLVISNLTARGASQALFASAYAEKPMRDVHLSQVMIEARTAGRVSNAADWSFKDVTFRLLEPTGLKLENCQDVPQPEIGTITASELERFAEVRPAAEARAVRLGL